MIIGSQSAVVRKENIDDGTTLGKTVYQTADGRWWEEQFSPSTETGVINGVLCGDTVKW